MPNVRDAGVWGWPKELDGGSPRPASNIFAVLDDTTGFVLANYVWTWCEQVPGDPDSGSWQVIWGYRASPPDAVTATWVAPTAVRIDWVLPYPSTASTWIVRRQDGSEVGRVEGNITTLTDDRPTLGNTNPYPTSRTISYSVLGDDGSSQSNPVTSAPLVVSLDADTVTTSVAYPSQASDSTATVTVRWTPNATFGDPDFWQVWVAGLGFVGSQVPGSARSITVPNIIRGVQANVRIVPFIVNPSGAIVQAGNWDNTPNTNILPNVPRPQFWGPDGVSRLRYNFWGPAAGAATDYELQRYIGAGPWTPWLTTTSGGPHYLATTQPAYVRNRTRAPGGVSDWVQNGPASPINDITGPGAPVLTSWKPEASYGRMMVRGNWSTDPDTARGQIWFMNNNEGWQLAWDSAVSPGGALWLAFQAKQQAVAKVIVRCFDAVGNQGADAYAEYQLGPPGAWFDPIAGGTGATQTGQWRSDALCGPNTMLMGNSSSWTNVSCFFYGDALYNYIRNGGVGRTVTSIQVEYWRYNTAGAYACISPAFYVHDQASKLGRPPWFGGGWGGGNIGGNGDLGQCVARTDQYGPVRTPPFGWVMPNYFADWIWQGWKGLAIYRPGSQNDTYGQLADAGHYDGIQALCGRVWVYSLG